MDRDIEKDLLAWKQQEQRMPILLRGARQVGKSYVVEKIGRTHFDNLFIVNFELQPELIPCFETLNPFEIIQNLSLLMHQKIEVGKTLLFLDEIQDCPNAIRALRYFKEQIPALHVIAAGSLLEFTLNDAAFRMPVGRVMSLYLIYSTAASGIPLITLINERKFKILFLDIGLMVYASRVETDRCSCFTATVAV